MSRISRSSKQQPFVPPTSLFPPPPSTGPANASDDDVSPRTQAKPPVSQESGPVDYFSLKSGPPSLANAAPTDLLARRPHPSAGTLSPRDSSSTVISPASSNTIELPSASNSEGRLDESSRKSSFVSVTFREPRNKSLPQGRQRKTDAKRLRASSPSPVR